MAVRVHARWASGLECYLVLSLEFFFLNGAFIFFGVFPGFASVTQVFMGNSRYFCRFKVFFFVGLKWFL